MATMFGLYPFLMKLYADGGYQGPLFRRAVAKIMARVNVEIVKRSDHAKEFVVLPKRWVVERTFAWLGRCRRLAKDWDKFTSKGARISAPRFNQTYAEKTMQSSMISPTDSKSARPDQLTTKRVAVDPTTALIKIVALITSFSIGFSDLLPRPDPHTRRISCKSTSCLACVARPYLRPASLKSIVSG